MKFKMPHPGFAQGLFFDSIPRRRGALVVTVALIFNGQNRPAASIDNKNVGSLAVYRMKCVLIG